MGLWRLPGNSRLLYIFLLHYTECWPQTSTTDMAWKRVRVTNSQSCSPWPGISHDSNVHQIAEVEPDEPTTNRWPGPRAPRQESGLCRTNCAGGGEDEKWSLIKHVILSRMLDTSPHAFPSLHLSTFGEICSYLTTWISIF